VRQALLRLAQDAGPSARIGGKRVKTIRGTNDEFHRVRVGALRIMYDVIPDEQIVLVLGIVDPADVERWLRGR
jgi:mRNA-degrading endonuclease RelE of RelBE toxin-antitoxin system